MSKVASHDDGARAVPACQWSFNRGRQFHYIGGNSAILFQRATEEPFRGHVSTVDDSGGSWAARLDRLFSGNSLLEQWSARVADATYLLVQVPVPANDGTVNYVAGFAYRDGQEIPAAGELELAALAALQVLEKERLRTARFMHDVAAQCLSSTGLQLELLRLEMQARNVELPRLAADIERELEDALRRIRAFNASLDDAS